MEITITPKQIPYLGKETLLELRVYPEDSFYDDENQFITPTSEDTPVVKADCIVSNGIITTPQIVLDSSYSPTSAVSARYAIAGVYKKNQKGSAAPLIKIIENFEVPESLGATITWSMLDTSNNALVNYRRDRSYDVYSKEQTDYLVADALQNVSIPNATNLLAGKVRLDSAASNPALPVAVGVDSPRLNKFVSDYASLSAALADIGTLNKTVLQFPPNYAVADNITIPNNISPHFTGNVNIASGKTLTIENGQGLQANPSVQVFGGAGKVKFTKSYPEKFHPEWFGAVGDSPSSAATNSAAFAKMIESMANPAVNIQNGRKAGGAVELALGKSYYLAESLRIRRPLHMFASGGERDTAGSGLIFPAGKVGIIVDAISSVDGTFNDATQTGQWSRLENFYLGAIGTAANNAVVDIASDFTMTLKAGGAITQASIQGQAGASLVPGSTVSVNGAIYTVSAAMSRGTPTATISIEKPRLYVTTGGILNDVISLNGSFASTDWVGGTLKIKGVTYNIVAVPDASHIKIDTPLNLPFGHCELQSMPAKTNQQARLNIYHGLDLRIMIQAQGLRIYGFNGNGINMNSEQFPTAALGTEPNNDLSTFARFSIQQNSGSGIVIYGVNSQPMQLDSMNVENSGGWGVYEEGSSGVLFNAPHLNENRQGTFRLAGAAAQSQLNLPYVEGGQPPALVNNAIAISPINFAVDTEYSPDTRLFLEYSQITSPSGLRFVRRQGTYLTVNSKSLLFAVGSGSAPNTFLQLGAAEETANIANGGTEAGNIERPAYFGGYDQFAAGWYHIGYNEDGSYATSGSNAIIAFSGSQASGGGGKLAFPKGFRTQLTDTPITRIRHGIATLASGTVTINDLAITANSRIFINRFTDGGTIGASYSVSRTAGVSFTVTAKKADGTTQTAETSVICYEIIEP